MRKDIVLPVTAWLGGIAGFVLRRWELGQAYDPQLRLMSMVPATWMLWALSGALFVLFALCCRKMDWKRNPRQWFYAPETGYIMLMVSAGFILLASGVAGFWKADVQRMGMMLKAAYGLFIPAGVCVLLMGQAAYRHTWSKHTPLLAMLPSFAVLVWLIACYQDNAKQPQIEVYVWHMLAAIALVLATYTVVTLAVGRGGAGRASLFGLMGIVLTGTTLADAHKPATVLVYLFALLYLTAQSWMLLRNSIPRLIDIPVQSEKDEPTHTEE